MTRPLYSAALVKFKTMDNDGVFRKLGGGEGNDNYVIIIRHVKFEFHFRCYNSRIIQAIKGLEVASHTSIIRCKSF